MKIFLTGGTGFIGGTFLRHALAAGHHILALARQPSPYVHPQLQWLTGSLADWSTTAVAAFAPDVCVHAAWIATPGVYLESQENHEHVRWSLQLAHQLPRLGLTRLIVVGTCLEKNLTSTYARCKLELHQQLLTHPELQLTWARVFYPYGLGEPADKFCSSTIAKFRRGESLHLQNPKAQRDYIQVDDLAAALCTLVTSDFTGSVDLGTGQGVTMQDLSATLAAMLNRPDLIQIPDQPPAGDSLIANPAPLHQLGWKPQISLEDGLRQMVLS